MLEGGGRDQLDGGSDLLANIGNEIGGLPPCYFLMSWFDRLTVLYCSGPAMMCKAVEVICIFARKNGLQVVFEFTRKTLIIEKII